MPATLYSAHVESRQRRAERALEGASYDRLVLSSGSLMRYHADDHNAPFHPNPHFASWLPAEGPGHLLEVRPGARPRLIRFAPEDFWYEQAPLGTPYWAERFDLVEVSSVDEAWAALSGGRAAFVGDSVGAATAHGFSMEDCNPEGLLARLDWDRAAKTPYEIECTRIANEAAARGHRAATAAFEDGADELTIHHAYVSALPGLDESLPYASIVALDEKGAILHYLGKRRGVEGRVLLLDAGATHAGYASDITRTRLRGDVPTTFRALRDGMETLELALCDGVRVGTPYVDLHIDAHRRIAALLCDLDILKGSADDAFERGLTRPFFPHGLGHFLGIQTHDVSGHQTSPEGGTTPPPDDHPFLRTTRTLEADHLVTIEPGVYMIEMLLRPFRDGAHKDAFNWPLIAELTPFGGVRIEDDVVATPEGPDNLTRPYLAD